MNWGVNAGGAKFGSFICAETFETVPGGHGVYVIVNGQNLGSNREHYYQVVPNDNSSQLPAGFPYVGGNCSGCNNAIIKYDCVNGNCVEWTAYNTHGLFDDLSDCQNNCGTNTNNCAAPFQCIDPSNFCPPGKVCVPQDEWGQITSLVHQNISKHCH